MRTTLVFSMLLLVSLTLAGHHEKETAGQCPVGWTRHQDHCYVIPACPLNWYDARAFCAGAGGHLVEINSQDEQDFVFKFFLNASLPEIKDRETDCAVAGLIWLGLTDRAQNGTFMWDASGNALNYTNWKAEEPNNLGGNEWCGQMYNSQGLWNDDQCYCINHFVCKTK